MGVSGWTSNNMNTILFVCLTSLVGYSAAYPNHAECRVFYTIPLGCAAVKSGLSNAANDWHLEGECLYQVDQSAGSSEGNTLTGYHLTPVFKYQDNFTFAFTNGDNGVSCNVEGFSSSTVSYAYFDYGTNYCNLRNLMDGAGISGLEGFAEDTNTDICMQFDEINCKKY